MIMLNVRWDSNLLANRFSSTNSEFLTDLSPPAAPEPAD